MSRENVELVRRLVTAYDARDGKALIALFDPLAEVHARFVAVGGVTIYRGHDGVRRWLADLEDVWGAWPRAEAEALFDLGEQTLLYYVLRARGRQSGAETVMAWANVARWRDGLCVYLKTFADRREALAELGVSDEELADHAVTVSPNLDLVRSILADWERGKFGAADWADPEIEFVRADGPAPGSWSGFQDIAGAVREVLSAWSEFRLTADEYRELDEERVLVFVQVSARGKMSGLDAGLLCPQAAEVFHLRGGKVTRIVTYYDRDRALADLSLAPDAGSERS